MARYYLQPWKNKTWRRHLAWSREPLRHTSGDNLGHILSGDVLYPATVLKGKLLVAGRFVVGKCVGEAEARRIMKTKQLWSSQFHLIAADEPGPDWDFNRQIPDDITAQLLMTRSDGVRPLRFRAPGVLDVQTLRGLAELTPASARLLDDYLGRAAPRPKAPDAPVLDDDFELPEGRETLVEHRRRERSTLLVKRKKELATARDELHCEICGFDYGALYGPVGEGFIEIHHLVPLSSLAREEKTRLDDLALVCSNCHRMLHRGNDLLSPDQLIEMIVEANPEADEDEE